MATLLFILAPSAFAAKKSFSFSVNPSINNGKAYSAPNPKDDSEQNAYIYTTNHNILDIDTFWYNVRGYASPNAPSYSGWILVTPQNADRIVKSYTRYASSNIEVKLLNQP
ncbi:MAG TPA: hypothetical protein VKZ77_14230 [Bacillaceae bacterium]|nr:hypothetical protein [Bacillaceae bacterium]